MTKFEIKYLLKYLAIMIVPMMVVFYLVELLFNHIFNDTVTSSLEELISKSVTIIMLIGFLGIFKKENKDYYTQENLVSGLYLTFNAVVFLFLLSCLLLGVDAIISLVTRKEIFSHSNVGSIVINIVFTTIFIIINLTKNIKLLQ